MASTTPRESRLSHDRRILLMALASALPGAAISLIFLWTGDYTPKVQWTLTVDGVPDSVLQSVQTAHAETAHETSPAPAPAEGEHAVPAMTVAGA